MSEERYQEARRACQQSDWAEAIRLTTEVIEAENETPMPTRLEIRFVLLLGYAQLQSGEFKAASNNLDTVGDLLDGLEKEEGNGPEAVQFRRTMEGHYKFNRAFALWSLHAPGLALRYMTDAREALQAVGERDKAVAACLWQSWLEAEVGHPGEAQAALNAGRALLDTGELREQDRETLLRVQMTQAWISMVAVREAGSALYSLMVNRLMADIGELDAALQRYGERQAPLDVRAIRAAVLAEALALVGQWERAERLVGVAVELATGTEGRVFKTVSECAKRIATMRAAMAQGEEAGEG